MNDAKTIIAGKKNMNTADQKTLETWGKSIDGNIPVTIVLNGDSQGKEIKKFCDQLSSLAPQVQVSTSRNDESEFSYIKASENLRFASIPQDKELEPFLEALQISVKSRSDLPEVLPENQFPAMKSPAVFELFVTPQCVFCPTAVKGMVAAVSNSHGSIESTDGNESNFVTLYIIDGMFYNEKAAAQGIKSVPTLILDDGFRWTGSIKAAEAMEMAANRDPAAMGADTMEGILMEGKAGFISDLMAGEKKIFPAIIEILAKGKWSERLGAMVAMEDLIDKHPTIAAQAAEPLWAHFEKMDDSAKGDALYILGLCAPPHFRSAFADVAKGDFSDEVKEAAAEAVEALDDATK